MCKVHLDGFLILIYGRSYSYCGSRHTSVVTAFTLTSASKHLCSSKRSPSYNVGCSTIIHLIFHRILFLTRSVLFNRVKLFWGKSPLLAVARLEHKQELHRRPLQAHQRRLPQIYKLYLSRRGFKRVHLYILASTNGLRTWWYMKGTYQCLWI